MVIPQGAPCAFKVGQVWRDGCGKDHRIVAITDHPKCPVVAQAFGSDGDASAFSVDGRWLNFESEFDLKALISEAQP